MTSLKKREQKAFNKITTDNQICEYKSLMEQLFPSAKQTISAEEPELCEVNSGNCFKKNITVNLDEVDSANENAAETTEPMTPTWALPRKIASEQSVSGLQLTKQSIGTMRPVNMSRRRLSQHELLEQARIEEENKDIKAADHRIATAEAPDVGHDKINRLRKKTGQQARDWFMRYYNQAQTVFDLKEAEIGKCMAKVEEMIVAKANGAELSGKRESYAAVILNIVSDELDRPIQMEEIVDKCGEGEPL